MVFLPADYSCVEIFVSERRAHSPKKKSAYIYFTLEKFNVFITVLGFIHLSVVVFLNHAIGAARVKKNGVSQACMRPVCLLLILQNISPHLDLAGNICWSISRYFRVT